MPAPGHTRSENIEGRHNPHQEIETYKQALRALVDAMGALTEAWEHLEFAGANVPDKGTPYPFGESFDELYHGVIAWAHDIEAASDPADWNVAPDVTPITSSKAAHARKIAEAAVRQYRTKQAGLTTEWEPIPDMGAYMQLRNGELFYCPMNTDGSREEDPGMEANIDPDIFHDERDVNMSELDLKQLRAIKQALSTEISEDGEIHEI
jgi:hypothetical protein